MFFVRDLDKFEILFVVNVFVFVFIGFILGMSRLFVRIDFIGERFGRYSSFELFIVIDEFEDLNLWWVVWNIWYRIGFESIKFFVIFDKLIFIFS